MTTISIIVPIYNQEKVMRKCLDSILKQTFSDWECILVDDGSTDQSGEICDEYARHDKRIKVIHKKNDGVAMARQTGVDNALGEYTIHADPDDYVEPRMLEDMYEASKVQNADILVCDFYSDKGANNTNYVSQPIIDNTIKGLVTSILRCKLHGSLCNKLAKRRIYTDYNAKFYPGINYSEDVLIWAQLVDKELKVAYLPKAYYHYVQNINSITFEMSPKLFDIQKNFLIKLNDTSVEKEKVQVFAHRIKMDALKVGLLSRNEYYCFFPISFRAIRHTILTIDRLFGYIAYFHLYYTAKTICILVEKIQENKFYKKLRQIKK